MRDNQRSYGLRLAISTFFVALFATGAWATDQEAVLHSFGRGTDGQYPAAGLIFDAAGNLYGTTGNGGIHGDGTVFEMIPNGSGGWTETVLHSFGNPATRDGQFPAAGLIFDTAGNLYGTTTAGGIHGGGTAFELSPNESGGWTETVLRSFGGGTDGSGPNAGLIFDDAGNLYGTTANGGIHGEGTVFEMTPGMDGGWTESVLHSFGRGTDASAPYAGLIFDDAGNLYGTTYDGGIHGYGALFELSPREDGGWTESVLHSFGNYNDGQNPAAGLIFDTAGNLYGTTELGGIHGVGALFELSPNGSGGWTETLVHSFGNGTDGTYPAAGLIFDTAGNLYSTSQGGGIYGSGTAFEFTPREGGGWTETVLHSFGSGTDGASPYSSLIQDSANNLYGLTPQGGIHDYGTVFVITP